MTRLTRACIGAFLGACSLSSGCGEPPAAGLLLITIDTCRADRIGCYGSERCETPAIDGLAEDGVVFLDAQAPAPLTLPSHCSILTGLYPDRHTIRSNGRGRLPDEAETLAEILAAKGWSTAAFVSAVPVGSQFGANQGFETYDETFTGSGGGEAATTRAPEEVAGRFFFDERVASETADTVLPWLREAVAGPRPFFAWVHFFDPHAVYRPPPAQAARYGPGSYEGEVAFVDEQIGRLLAALGDAGRNVTVVVTADHGEGLGDHEEASHGLFVYRSTMHVPWVIAGPAVPRGRRVADPVSLVDVLPTALEAIAVPAPEGIDGVSRLAAARGESAPDTDVFGECLLPKLHYNWAAIRSVRRGRWKLIDAPRPELFDVVSDPEEAHDLADANPEVVAELRRALEERAAMGPAFASEAADIDPLVREQLARLGYVGVGGPADPAADDDLWSTGGRDPKDMVQFYNRLQEVPTMVLQGRYDEADTTLRDLRRIDPENPRVLERHAMLCSVREQWAEAADLCAAYLRLEPDDTTIRKNLAIALWEAGDAAGARAAYRQVVEGHPEDAEAWRSLGSVLLADGRSEEALVTLRQAVEARGDDAALRATLARAHEEAGDVAAALEEYDAALAIDATLLEAINGKALLLSHSGRTSEAVRVLEEVLPRVGDDLDAINNLAWMLTNESIDPQRGFELARRAQSMAPDDPAVLDTLGWAAIRAGRPAEGIDPLTRAWEQTGDAEVRAHLGVALAESGRPDDGRSHVRAALGERPELAGIPEVAKWK